MLLRDLNAPEFLMTCAVYVFPSFLIFCYATVVLPLFFGQGGG